MKLNVFSHLLRGLRSFGNVCKCPELTCQPDIISIYPTKSVAIRLQQNVRYPIESGIFVQRAEKNRTRKDFLARFLVEVTGFEPATFWSRTKRATKLRYASTLEPKRGLGPLTYALRVRRSTD